ncbi:hypothetical protein AB0K60_33650 [Thermopolyspora sp. NPDC052614]|uniref:hypothetical protein n=1 Tax=Thermopolyspora sp. NPDC052614 TaxID=3155682 RepID=UPI00341681DF
MRGKRSLMLVGPALLVALALPPVAATGASAATGTATVVASQAVQAKAGTTTVAASDHARCKRFRHRTCCKRHGDWRCWNHPRRHHHRKFGHHRFGHHEFGHHAKFRHHTRYDRYAKFEYRDSFRHYGHGRW